MEIELKKFYGETYDSLLSEVKRRQHDFLNQLSVLASAHLTATSLEDLIQKQENYINVIMDKCKFDKILTGCADPILAGYLYNACARLDAQDISVDYKIIVNTGICKLTIYEVIEIMGILLTNAAENICINRCQKKIELYIVETSEEIVLSVANEVKELMMKDIDKLFEEGYSTKGANRGLGLPRLKELVEKSDSKLIIRKTDADWLVFKIIIYKNKEIQRV